MKKKTLKLIVEIIKAIVYALAGFFSNGVLS